MKFGTNLSDKLAPVATQLAQSPANIAAKAAVDAVLDGGDLFSEDEIEAARQEAKIRLSTSRQQTAEAEIKAGEIAKQIRSLEDQISRPKTIPGWQLTNLAKKIEVAETKIGELRRQLEKNDEGKKAAGVAAFKTMRDTLQKAFEIINALTGKEMPEKREQVYVEANDLYNQAMAQAIACRVFIPFADGKASIGDFTVTIDGLRGEKVKTGEDNREISREQREVVYGRGRTEIGGTEYNMYGAAFWAPGAQSKISVQGTVKSFRSLNGILRKISRALGEAKYAARKQLVVSSTLSAQDVLDREKDGTFAAFFPWDVQGGEKTVQAFLAVEMSGGVVTVADAQVCLRRQDVGIQYPGKLNSRLYGILRRLAETNPESTGGNSEVETKTEDKTVQPKLRSKIKKAKANKDAPTAVETAEVAETNTSA